MKSLKQALIVAGLTLALAGSSRGGLREDVGEALSKGQPAQLLPQAYRGVLKTVFESPSLEKAEKASGSKVEVEEELEFRYRIFRGKAEAEPIVPAIAVNRCEERAVNRGEEGAGLGTMFAYVHLAQVCSKFPDLKELEKMPLEDFEKIFGKQTMFLDGWGDFEGIVHTSCRCAAAVPLEDGSFKLVEAFLLLKDAGKGWEIEERSLRSGIFRPTGKPPEIKPEKLTDGQAAQEAAPGK